MRCSGCREPIALEVAHRGPAGFVFEPYCHRCEQSPRCAHCGFSYAAFQKKRLLSCELCYSAFQPELVLLLRRFRSKQQISVQEGTVSPQLKERTKALIHGAERGKEDPASAAALPQQKPDYDGITVRLRLMRNIVGLSYGYSLAGPLGITPDGELDSEPFALVSRLYSGDEDHLRYECLVRREDFPAVASLMQKKIDEISGLYHYQFHPQFGYLAACPTNSGGGVRLSLSLPVLLLPGASGRRMLARSGFEIRLPGNDRFELSNRFSSWPFDVSGSLEQLEHALYRARKW